MAGLEENLDFKGADIEAKYGIASASDCSKTCEQHPTCLAFTYVKSEQASRPRGSQSEGLLSAAVSPCALESALV